MMLFVLLVVGATQLTGDEIVQRTLATDPFGLADARVEVRMILKDRNGVSSDLRFSSLASRYDPPRSKSLLRFSAPPDLAGAGFLQIQRKDGDDERQLFLPEVKKTRRIAGSLRSNAFMGTDFSYADVDYRDVRESTATLKEERTLGKTAVYVVDVVPTSADRIYSKVELSVNKENFFVLKMVAYDKNGVLTRTLDVQELITTSGRLFIKRATMTSHKNSHTTEFFLDKVSLHGAVPDNEFTVRALEKL
jgi:hypothetical protein